MFQGLDPLNPYQGSAMSQLQELEPLKTPATFYNIWRLMNMKVEN